MVLKKKKMKMSYQERIPTIAQSSIESLFLRNKLSKIRFTYLDKEIDDYNINFEEVTELSYLMKSLKAHIENKFKKDSSIVEKKKLIYDPVSLFVLSNFGKITKVKSLSHMFELVRSFPGRKYIYFNIMPFFQIEGKVKDVKKCEVVEPELIVKERNSNVLVKSEDFSQEYLGNNFIETLDDINRDRVNLVLEMFPGNDPKKIFDLINTYDGDVDKVMEELLGS